MYCSHIDRLSRRAIVFDSLPMLGYAMELAGGEDRLPEVLNCSAGEVQAILRRTHHTRLPAALMLPTLDAFTADVHAAMRRLDALDAQLEQVGQ
jgi:hypothetical protein